MTRPTAGLLAVFGVAALGSIGCSPSLGSRTCTPGRSVSCACGGGLEGHQVCRADGEGFDDCICDDAGVPRTDGGTGIDASSVPDGGSPGIDAGPPPVDAWTAPDVWTPPDTGPPPPTCSWVWLDRGGPAFTPTPCRAGPGVVGGMLVDPRAFFEDLVAGRDPDTWQTVMDEIEPVLWSCGVGQQRGSGGDVRGRLFLPTASCPDSSPPPGDTTAEFLGVRQDPPCWDHPADVVDCP